MARQYPSGSDDDSRFFPPARSPGAIDTHGLGPRHWTLLTLVAEHGVLSTDQVVILMFGSRPAASRHLSALTQAGLLWRFVYDDDSSHLAYYEMSQDGVEALRQRLRREGRPVPAALGAQLRDHYLVSHVRVGLAAETRTGGPGRLYRWRRALEAAALLRQAGISHVHPRAYGEWIERDIAIRFLLHIDSAVHHPLVEAAPPSQALAGYRNAENGVPATAVLVVTEDAGRHDALHRELAAQPLPVTVAVAMADELYKAANAADQIWSIAGADPAQRVSLIDVPCQPGAAGLSPGDRDGPGDQAALPSAN